MKKEVWAQLVYTFLDDELESLCDLGVKSTSLVLKDKEHRSLQYPASPMVPDDEHPRAYKPYQYVVTRDSIQIYCQSSESVCQKLRQEKTNL